MANSTDRRAGLGITLGVDVSGPSGTTFVAVGGLADDLGFSGFSINKVETHGIADLVAMSAPGRLDYGTFTGNQFYVPGDAGVVLMRATFSSRTICAWQLGLNDSTTVTNASTLTFPGWISTYTPPKFSGDDSPKAAFEITITDAVVYAAGTAKS